MSTVLGMCLWLGLVAPAVAQQPMTDPRTTIDQARSDEQGVLQQLDQIDRELDQVRTELEQLQGRIDSEEDARRRHERRRCGRGRRRCRRGRRR